MTSTLLPTAVDSSLVSEEGTIPFPVGTESYETWYKIFGKLAGGTQPPLIVLHGGPGTRHVVVGEGVELMAQLSGITYDYMLPFSDLAKAGDRAVIFYDQLGNGRSTHLFHKTEEFWTIDLFIDELVNLIHHFQLELFDIAGHSWGCTLGLEYLIRRQPAGARRFLALNGPASIPRYMEAFSRNLKSFSKEVQEGVAMQKMDFVRFRAAQDEYDAKHTCVVVPFPCEFVYSMESHWAPTGGDDTVSRIMSVPVICHVRCADAVMSGSTTSCRTGPRSGGSTSSRCPSS
jgi:pimeloyl-ACP methyl ester carboxylesterase